MNASLFPEVPQTSPIVVPNRSSGLFLNIYLLLIGSAFVAVAVIQFDLKFWVPSKAQIAEKRAKEKLPDAVYATRNLLSWIADPKASSRELEQRSLKTLHTTLTDPVIISIDQIGFASYLDKEPTSIYTLMRRLAMISDLRLAKVEEEKVIELWKKISHENRTPYFVSEDEKKIVLDARAFILGSIKKYKEGNGASGGVDITLTPVADDFRLIHISESPPSAKTIDEYTDAILSGTTPFAN